MSGTVSYFDKRARVQRRDALVEEAFQALRALAAVIDDEVELRATLVATEAVKKLRRAEVVQQLERSQMNRIKRGEPS